MAKITKSAVDRLLPGRSLWDAETRGFGVRMQARDATYVLKARIHRRQRFFTIGNTARRGRWIPPERKRSGCSAWSQRAGIQRQNATAPTTPSLDGLAEAFMLRHVAAKRKPSTAAFYGHVIDTHVLPTLGRRRAIDVTRADVAKLHNDLRGKTEGGPTAGKAGERSKGGPYIVNRALAIIASMYSWAGNAGLIADAFNPAARVERPSPMPFPGGGLSFVVRHRANRDNSLLPQSAIFASGNYRDPSEQDAPRRTARGQVDARVRAAFERTPTRQP